MFQSDDATIIETVRSNMRPWRVGENMACARKAEWFAAEQKRSESRQALSVWLVGYQFD